jgi:hypothetical protein
MAKKRVDRKRKVGMEQVEIPLPPQAPRFPEFARVQRVGFHNLTTWLQILVIFGWVFFAIVLINMILAIAIFLAGGA